MFKIGEVAQKLGVRASTLRFYESRGMVHPQRSEGGTRFYSQEDVERFRVVLELAELGVSLKQIQRLAQVRGRHGTGDGASREVATLLGELLGEMEGKRRRLGRLVEDMALAQRQVGGCHGCEREPTTQGCTGCSLEQVLTGEGGTQIFRLIWESKGG